MRQVTITTPQGRAADVARIAFDAGVPEVSVNQTRIVKPDGSETLKERVEFDTGTHVAKAFVDSLTTASFFSTDQYSIAVRQPRSIVSSERLAVLLRPLVEPTSDLFQELCQFCQITYGFVGRILIGAILLALGILDDRLLLMIAGLLFIPLLPLILGIGFSLRTRHWYLLRISLVALVTAFGLLVVGGIVVALLNNRAIRYSESSSLVMGFLVSLAVGVAGALATGDDVGRREMIGLAATAQVAMIPVWFGLSIIIGFSDYPSVSPTKRLVALILNVFAIVIASYVTYIVLRVRGAKKLTTEKAD